jgi:hypothetical protein
MWRAGCARFYSSNWVVANLAPDEYACLSPGTAEDSPPDAAQGMLGALIVTGEASAAADAPALQPDVTSDMVDMARRTMRWAWLQRRRWSSDLRANE